MGTLRDQESIKVVMIDTQRKKEGVPAAPGTPRVVATAPLPVTASVMDLSTQGHLVAFSLCSLIDSPQNCLRQRSAESEG